MSNETSQIAYESAIEDAVELVSQEIDTLRAALCSRSARFLYSTRATLSAQIDALTNVRKSIDALRNA